MTSEYSAKLHNFMRGAPSVTRQEIDALLDEIERLQSESASTCEWTFFGCGKLFGSPTGFMKTSCGHNWGELVDYKTLTFCPHCGKKIAAPPDSEVE